MTNGGHPMTKIVTNIEILGGKPVIAGTRISVEFVLRLLASGMTESEILDDYPHLTREGIHECLNYAADSIKNDVYLSLEAAQ